MLTRIIKILAKITAIGCLLPFAIVALWFIIEFIYFLYVLITSGPDVYFNT